MGYCRASREQAGIADIRPVKYGWGECDETRCDVYKEAWGKSAKWLPAYGLRDLGLSAQAFPGAPSNGWTSLRMCHCVAPLQCGSAHQGKRCFCGSPKNA